MLLADFKCADCGRVHELETVVEREWCCLDVEQSVMIRVWSPVRLGPMSSGEPPRG